MLPKVIFIVGPTSSGKSAVAVRLAETLKGEIISCDSMQIYRDMNIITQAPGNDLLSRVPHHLVGTIPPEEEFNAARFVKEARALIESMVADKKTPVVAGGTGLYLKSIIDGIFTSPPKDGEFRRQMRDIAREKGNDYLYGRLCRIDPDTAAKLHPNDQRRIIRALEVFNLTGNTIHEKKIDSKGISGKYNCRMFGLEFPRKVLYERINSTVDKMFEEGVLDEVKRLMGRNLSLTAEKALGIKEIRAVLNEQLSLEQAREELKKNTRHYAKRQLTWVRADKRIKWIDANRSVEEIVKDILREVGR